MYHEERGEPLLQYGTDGILEAYFCFINRKIPHLREIQVRSRFQKSVAAARQLFFSAEVNPRDPAVSERLQMLKNPPGFIVSVRINGADVVERGSVAVQHDERHAAFLRPFPRPFARVHRTHRSVVEAFRDERFILFRDDAAFPFPAEYILHQRIEEPVQKQSARFLDNDRKSYPVPVCAVAVVHPFERRLNTHAQLLRHIRFPAEHARHLRP